MKDLKAKIKIQDDTPGQGVKNPPASAGDAVLAFENPEVPAVVEHRDGDVWEVRYKDRNFFIEATKTEAVIQIPLTWNSLESVASGVEYATDIESVLNDAGIDTDSYVV